MKRPWIQWVFYALWVSTIFSYVYYRLRPKTLAEIHGVKYQTMKFEVKIVAVPPYDPLNLVSYNGILYRFEYIKSGILWTTSSYQLDSSYPGIAPAEIRENGRGGLVAFIAARPVKVFENENWVDWTEDKN